jgi:ABC-type multidrug transport system ATPase subunit
MTNEAVIFTHALTKSYGGTEAVRGLNLSVGRNRITAFLGRNGAGKSTTIKMLLGMIRPTVGEKTDSLSMPSSRRWPRGVCKYIAPQPHPRISAGHPCRCFPGRRYNRSPCPIRIAPRC